jgi:hypothetical protein
MTISGSTISRPTTPAAERPSPRYTPTAPASASASVDAPRTVDLAAPIALTDISCWRLLTARVPLTLLLDLALPSEDEFAGLYEELLAEPTSVEWVPNRTL